MGCSGRQRPAPRRAIRSSMMVVCRTKSSRTSRSSRRSPSVMRPRWSSSMTVGLRSRPAAVDKRDCGHDVLPVDRCVGSVRTQARDDKRAQLRLQPGEFERVLFTPTVSKVLPPDCRAGRPPRQPIWRLYLPHSSRIVGHTMAVHRGSTIGAARVNKPLTMIKGTLPTRFSSICQTDRMGYGNAT